ncbi:qde-2-interacting protein [Fusarium sporotrichioides]|uniref:Qde-2-interacting protein n=1 Tax=Fusarium sporotrichioides TaxID=5514 RepID=A0A395STL7_FUSSP|nr:qde-2-interacting protein [Fusarium sporotrichioides]
MSHLQSRLEKLQELLGNGVKLAETPHEDNTKENSAATGFGNSYGMVMDDEYIRNEERLAAREQASQEQLRAEADAARQGLLESNKKKAFDNTGFRIGQPVHKDSAFCPFKVVVSYPERFIGKVNKPRVKPLFTQILQDRTWDFFYLHDPMEPARDPYLLIPSAQFEVFLEEINLKLGIFLRIPVGAMNKDKFYMKFGEGGTPRPRYLRRSLDATSLDIRPWPSIDPEDIKAFEAAAPPQKLTWRSKMRVVKTGFTSKKTADPDKAAKKKRHRDQMLRNTLGYLGLMGDPDGHDIVFICVDVEAIERKPNPVSEVGISILDTRDIKGVHPKDVGRGWWPMIKTHHLRVHEYAGLRNYQFVKGCPDSFDFGKSIFPQKAELQETIMGIFQPYLVSEREIIVVGHDVRQDITYFNQIGIDLRALAGLTEPVDTQHLHQAWCSSTNGRGLVTVLNDLNIPNKHLHNAGNDAHYTLCAMLGIAVQEVNGNEQQSNEMLNRVD